jgi:hypothetical protein
LNAIFDGMFIVRYRVSDFIFPPTLD